MNRDGRDFRNSQRLDNFKSDYSYNNKERRTKPQRYTSKKSVRNMKRNVKLGVATAILAAEIGMASISISGCVNQRNDASKNYQIENSVTTLQNDGINLFDLGLENDTIQTMKKYDEYFENFDSNNVTESKEDIIEMLGEIKTLNFNVIKDKIAEENGVERKDVTLYYRFEKADGQYYTSILINEGKYDQKTFTSANALPFGIGAKNYIPEELSDLIVQLEEYDELREDIENNDISEINAIKKLNGMYQNISDVATSDLTIDEKGNISLEHYENEKDVEQAEKDGEER